MLGYERSINRRNKAAVLTADGSFKKFRVQPLGWRLG